MLSQIITFLLFGEQVKGEIWVLCINSRPKSIIVHPHFET